MRSFLREYQGNDKIVLAKKYLFVIIVAALAGVFLNLSLTQEKRTTLFLAGLTFNSIIAVMILKDVLLGKFDLLNTKYFVFIGFFLHIGFGLFQTILVGAYIFYDYSIIMKSIILSVVGFCFFCLGYNSQIGNSLSNHFCLPQNKYSDNFIKNFALLIILITLAGLLFRVRHYGGLWDFAMTPYSLKYTKSFWEHLGRFFSRLYMPSVILSVYVISSGKYSNFSKSLFLCFLFVIFFFCIIQGARWYISTFSLLSILSVYATRTLSFRKLLLWVVPLVLISLFFINIQTNIRKNPTLLFNSDQKVFSWVTPFEECNAYPHFLEILTKFPKVYDYTYGRSFYNILTNFIPRCIWENKPIGFGKFLAVQIYGSHESVSYGGTIIGESYVNFSWIGVIIILFMLGIVAKIFYDMYSKNKNDIITITFYLMNLVFFWGVIRGDLLSIVFPALGNLITLYILLKISVSFHLFLSGIKKGG